MVINDLINDRNGNDSEGVRSLQFKTSFEGNPDKLIKVIAYAFDQHGKLLVSNPVQDDSVQLELSPDQARTARLFLASEHPQVEGKEPVTLDTMERLCAYETTWAFDPEKRVYELLPIPEYLWKRWYWRTCRVRGQVVKPVNIADVTTNLPICRARVHICEIEPLWRVIPRLPDSIIIRLREELLKEIGRGRLPIPIDDPSPFKSVPEIVDPSPGNIASMNRAVTPTPQPSSRLDSASQISLQPNLSMKPLMAGKFRATDVEVIANQEPVPLKESTQTSPQIATPQMAIETHVALTSASVPVVRQALQNNIALLRPHICLWSWLWPWLCRHEETDRYGKIGRYNEVAVLITDGQGRFDTAIWYSCFDDRPDLYFWVEYCIGGSWTIVYRPDPICCHTHWNYLCSSEVTLYVSDPRVYPCGPVIDLTGLQVAILSIGQEVSMHEIPVNAPGAGTTTEGLANGINPFGGQLEPRVFFSRTKLFALGITHYRWSYRQITQSDGITSVSDTWHAMDRRVIRHYVVSDPVTSSLSFPTYPLGPDPVYPGQNLFQIQPINAPTGRPEDWVLIDAHEDYASAFFLSHLLGGGNAEAAAGKYELKLELFNPTVSSTKPVDLTAAGIGLKMANVNAPFGAGTVTTEDADDNHRFKDSAGHTVAFRLVLHVDNNVCDSAIYPISNPSGATGLTVNTDCGFVQYQPNANARIRFTASHPHGFAMFSFNTTRGTATDVPIAGAKEQQVNVAMVNDFVRTDNIFSKDVPVNTLLTENTSVGRPLCTKAAFSEMLIVQAMATDGWQLLSHLNPVTNPKQIAYALEPA